MFFQCILECWSYRFLKQWMCSCFADVATDFNSEKAHEAVDAGMELHAHLIVPYKSPYFFPLVESACITELLEVRRTCNWTLVWVATCSGPRQWLGDVFTWHSGAQCRGAQLDSPLCREKRRCDKFSQLLGWASNPRHARRDPFPLYNRRHRVAPVSVVL